MLLCRSAAAVRRSWPNASFGYSTRGLYVAAARRTSSELCFALRTTERICDRREPGAFAAGIPAVGLVPASAAGRVPASAIAPPFSAQRYAGGSSKHTIGWVELLSEYGIDCPTWTACGICRSFGYIVSIRRPIQPSPDARPVARAVCQMSCDVKCEWLGFG
jgi:hypothetical protein